MMWRQFLAWIASKLDYLVIKRPDGPEYLIRYFIRRGHDRWSLYLHHFIGSDPDVPHNHPNDLGVGLILTTGYWEDRYTSTAPPLQIERKWVRPFSINVIRHDTFHRVVLDNGRDVWTLFFRTGRNKGWGFKQADGMYTPAHETGPLSDGEVLRKEVSR
jgi:hypothetical protein